MTDYFTSRFHTERDNADDLHRKALDTFHALITLLDGGITVNLSAFVEGDAFTHMDAYGFALWHLGDGTVVVDVNDWEREISTMWYAADFLTEEGQRLLDHYTVHLPSDA